MIAGEPYTLGLFDTPSCDENYMNMRLRLLSYAKTDVFLVLFSVVNPASFENAEVTVILILISHPLTCFFNFILEYFLICKFDD